MLLSNKINNAPESSNQKIFWVIKKLFNKIISMNEKKN